MISESNSDIFTSSLFQKLQINVEDANVESLMRSIKYIITDKTSGSLARVRKNTIAT